jgi:hypothetical protein
MVKKAAIQHVSALKTEVEGGNQLGSQWTGINMDDNEAFNKEKMFKHLEDFRSNVKVIPDII